ncbi:MAG TPA: twin-arginine translocase TatA/TatE family subunit [Terriglobales bacterium]|nr:twin-arginine translocase TatA/TatE family subunit [Terriglobales bacterium]
MFGSIGMPELIVIFMIVLLVFGPTKLPDLGKSLGEAIRGLKKAMKESGSSTLEGSNHYEKSRESSTKAHPD